MADSVLDMEPEARIIAMTANAILKEENLPLMDSLRILLAATAGGHTSLLIHLTTGQNHFICWATVTKHKSPLGPRQPTPMTIGRDVANAIVSLSRLPYLHYYETGDVRILASFK